MAAALNAAGRAAVYDIARNRSTYGLSPGSIWLGVILGIFLPLISNILPIQAALGKTLRTSLDLYQRSAGELAVSMKALQEHGLSVNQLLFAILLVVLGALTYYVVPSAFLFKQYGLFFGVFDVILLLLLLGMTFLAVLFLPFLQRFFVVIFLWIIRQDLKLK